MDDSIKPSPVDQPAPFRGTKTSQGESTRHSEIEYTSPYESEPGNPVLPPKQKSYRGQTESDGNHGNTYEPLRHSDDYEHVGKGHDNKSSKYDNSKEKTNSEYLDII